MQLIIEHLWVTISIKTTDIGINIPVEVGLNCKKRENSLLNNGNLDCAQIARHSPLKRG